MTQASLARISPFGKTYLSERLQEGAVKSFTITDIDVLSEYLRYDTREFLLAVDEEAASEAVVTRLGRRVGGPAQDSGIDEPMAAGSRGDVPDPEITDA